MHKTIGIILTIAGIMASTYEASAQEVKVREDIVFSMATKISDNIDKPLLLDFYEAIDNDSTPRPLVIALFGGGFVAGSRKSADVTEFCNRFARLGYAAAAIDYRTMKMTQFNNDNLIRSGYMATQDLSAAIRFFKANHEQYSIDTNNIFLIGNSAGSVAILHLLFMDEDERPAVTMTPPDLGTLHSTGQPEAMYHTASVTAAVCQWGCIFGLDMIDSEEDTPLCLIHGTEDVILPCDSGYCFRQKRLPFVYGSNAISKRLDEIGSTQHELHLFHGYPHGFYFNMLYMYWLNRHFDECFETAFSFFEKNKK